MPNILLSQVGEVESVYGVDVDIESFAPPIGLRAIGFIYKEDKGAIDTSLLDTIISYSLAGVDVTIEVPFELGVDAKDLISLASNLSTNLSMLPPLVVTDESIEAYAKLVGVLAERYFAMAGFSKMIYPLTSYVEYLVVEVVSADVSAYKPTDNYVIDSFASKMTVEQSDQLKDLLRAKIYEIHGDRAAFERYVRTIVKGVYERVEKNISDMRESLVTD